MDKFYVKAFASAMVLFGGFLLCREVSWTSVVVFCVTACLWYTAMTEDSETMTAEAAAEIEATLMRLAQMEKDINEISTSGIEHAKEIATMKNAMQIRTLGR